MRRRVSEMKASDTMYKRAAFAGLFLLLAACSNAPEGLAPAQPAGTTVKMDFYHEPLPEIALPNDVATRYDETSPTHRRVNASMLAPTRFEARTRELLDRLDGWGVYQAITVPFTGPIDVNSILSRHRDADYDTSDDAIYLVNIDPASPELGKIHHLDLGNGNYPVSLEKRDLYWKNDPREDLMSLVFDETDEDRNRNGVLDGGEDQNGNGTLDPGEDADGDGALDPPEDTDADGILDAPNRLPGTHPAADDLAGRADALMTFYERTTNTLIARPMVPLRERTRYAVVVTRRVLDASGAPVGSPYPFINHASQTEDLRPLLDVLPPGLSTDDIAFTYSYTTQTIEADWKAVRDGLYGHGAQAHLATEFPAEVDELLPLRDESKFPGMTQPHLMYGEAWAPALDRLGQELLGASEGEFLTTLVEGTGYVDYYVIGSYQSPQLFAREDASGVPLGLNDQSWPADLERVPAKAHAETVYFTLAVPRKEISARGEGKPVPVALLGHGYTGNRFDALEFPSFVAKHGIAVLAIDGPSHGISIGAGDAALAKVLLGSFGLSAAGNALLHDRAFDQDGDGDTDSGADFWTAYMFHTRDMVRQFAVDYMQLVRVLRSFDGQRRWKLDLNGDGQPELAGDFDGDGAVDVGAGSELSMFGASLGGMMAMIVGSVEPQVRVIAPISGGGGYGDIGPRSKQGGVPEAFILRSMGPIFVGTADVATGEMLLETVVPDLNEATTVPIGMVSGIAPWDTLVVENLENGERGCGYVSQNGTVRASIASDAGDAVRLSIYKGDALVTGDIHCAVRPGKEPHVVVEQFAEGFTFQSVQLPAGSPLVALAEGLGLKRGHPDLRRFQGLGQLVLDPADPAVLARHMSLEPMTYPGTGETTGAHALIISTIGDMSVPVASGISVGRAAGLIDYLNVDPRYGKPVNQELIDTYTTEGIDVFKRYVTPEGVGVHLDVENFSQGTDRYGTDVQRLETPLRIGMSSTDRLGGVSAAIFPYADATGQHGFDLPGETTDKVRNECRAACMETEGEDPCGCGALTTFDVGRYMLNMIGRYTVSGGMSLDDDLCQSRDDCADHQALPPARALETLP